MTLAWLSLDLVVIVLFAFSLPAVFLYVIRRWLENSERAEPSAEHRSPDATRPPHS
ncbi:hypothetical protein NXS98_11865 [Fontisphaera persica]|uniref:hypothetical protein n=1 Tax=Fontisphaera persica TaxID=2974023 RepID=UPI0024C00A2A|nr:hypothetical protein [Fontisphaera persica]WCJ58417.1 hypothetical protein NXS98_11865 [Fontisphaera persica]